MRDGSDFQSGSVDAGGSSELILTGAMRDSFKFDVGMRVEKQKIMITRYGRYLNKCNYSTPALGLTTRVRWPD